MKVWMITSTGIALLIVGLTLIIAYIPNTRPKLAPGFQCGGGFVVPEGKFKHLAIIGDNSACAVRETGEIVCWRWTGCP